MMQDQQPRSISTFDYVVVGAGAAGSIVAARLSEDPGITVCALVPVHRTGTRIFTFQRASSKSCSMKPTLAEPSPNVNGRSVIIPVGRTVGGSSSINCMIINRG